MRNNGRYTAAEEMIAMAGAKSSNSSIKTVCTGISNSRATPRSLYNVAAMEPVVKRFLQSKGVEIHLSTRIDDVEMKDGKIQAVTGKRGKKRSALPGTYSSKRPARRASGPVFEVRQRVRHVHPPLPHLRRKGQYCSQVRVTEMIGRKGPRSER